MINLILCGGNGTRLWPLSKENMPKQFIKIFNNQSLFQITAKRNHELCDSRLIVSNEKQHLLAKDQLLDLNIENNQFLVESIARNTAAAITLACLSVDPEELLLVTPSDHFIKDIKSYKESIIKGKKLAEEGFIVTFGIKPTYPETGFGYIESEYNFNIKAFREKPDLLTAKNYILSENFYWNSGMFLFKAKVLLGEIKKHSKDIYEECVYTYNNRTVNNNTIKFNFDDMINIRNSSIDYEVMEKSSIIKLVPTSDELGWSDLGSFDSLSNYLSLTKIDYDNLVLINSENNYIHTTNHKLVAMIDIDDLIVIDTEDSLLIVRKGSSQKVKDIIDKLKINKSHLL
ncbi:mannose-1-phosphate guanylyltransferase [Gallibacterium anatis]|uniref:mannose-1-phosphate guanylyltransferase n=1 Tax=Gallibacterium anatis TaxID=750 RepID=UPI0022B24795|nr:mannose-1-phosphate guanylyltransferase [Gallibacterium anatis]WAX72508.1 mannose-1-phosphate guanylyltransferase [Gallibacterium anatis]